MITGELKNRIDSIREISWTSGLNNPLERLLSQKSAKTASITNKEVQIMHFIVDGKCKS